MPIFLAPINEEVTISFIKGDEKVKRHLAELGLTVGGRVMVISRDGKSVVLLVKNTRLALDRDISGSILIA